MSSPSPPVDAQAHQLAVSYGVLLSAVIFLFMVVVFIFLLYLYAKRFLGETPLPGTPSSSRFLFVDDDESPLASRGLPAAVLRALPVTVYSKQQGSVECAVCLSEVADGDKVRALPKCGHGFHADCIDVWFRSRDTCPLCRAPVVEAAAEGLLLLLPRVPREEPALEFPTNVLFWGTQHDDVTSAVPPPPIAASTSSGRRKENLVIDVPTRPAAVNSHATSSSSPDEMWSPVSARLRSLRRLLSRGKQAVVGTSYSPHNTATTGDIEQGFAGPEAARPPKTPKTPMPRTN